MKAAAHDAHPCASPIGQPSAVQIGYPADLSLNADVTVAARDRAGLERLLRYCARPIFASERLQWIEKDQRLVYRLPKPRPDGQTVLYLTPMEFLDKLVVLIPLPGASASLSWRFGTERFITPSRDGLRQAAHG